MRLSSTFSGTRMSSTPPHQWPHTAEPTDEQLRQAKRIARKTGQTVEQVLAEAIKRGTSAQFADVLAGRTPITKPH